MCLTFVFYIFQDGHIWPKHVAVHYLYKTNFSILVCAFVVCIILCVGISNTCKVGEGSVFCFQQSRKQSTVTTPCIERSLRYGIKPNITHLFQNVSNSTHKIAVVTNALEGIIFC